MMGRYTHWGLLIGMLIVGSLLMIYQGMQKADYHVDEHWTYGFANSYDRTFIGTDLFYQPIPSDLFMRYVTVQADERFAYDAVYTNKSHDVHPPLYYHLIHTVSSLFVDQFSKWYGIAINIIFYLLTMIALFVLADVTLKSKTQALFVVALWAFSLGAISSVVFIRMYSMMTFFSVLLVLGALQFLTTKRWGYLGLVLIAVVLGGLTHYYFFISAFFLSAFVCLALLIGQRPRDLIAYSAVTLAGVGLVVALFPPIIQHVTEGYRGTEAIDGLKSLTVDLNYFSVIANSFIRLFTGLPAALPLIGVGVIGVLGLGAWLRYRPTVKPVYLILAGATLSSAYLITAIAPDMQNHQDRYLFSLTPIVALLLIAGVGGWLARFDRRWSYGWAGLVGLVLIHSSLIAESQYLFKDNQDFNRLIDDHHIIYITPEPFRATEMALRYRHVTDVFMVYAWEHEGVSYSDHILNYFQIFPIEHVRLVLIVEKRFADILASDEARTVFAERGYGLELIEPEARSIYDVYRIVELEQAESAG